MPLYEYQCENCGDVFEVMQKFSDAPLTEHPTCGGKVHRLLSAPALQFKGSGWYVNDYAKGSGSAPNGSANKDEGGSKASSSESASKPAATTTTSSDTKSSS
ncbi:MAG: putative regulatory protein FmdB family [Bryobacterales bacterium]|jgi:putative FmdB family regulatory protein|nr:putative regulatory protein FmdB family [Bryobacterales bacterium]